MKEIFAEDMWTDIEKILLNSTKNEYIDFFDQIVTKEPRIRKTLPVLVEYGLNSIKDTEDDQPLADYFFVLSGLRDIPETVRSFFMDAMIYCKDKHIEFKNSSEIRNFYEKEMRPLL